MTGNRVLIILAMAALSCAPAAAAPPQRVVSTFLCTDEYVFRLLPRARIAALSFEAGDRHPVISTIADQVTGITGLHPSTETVLNLHPDLVVMYQGTMPRLHENLSALGVPILDVPWANSIADIRKTTRWLGEKLGARDRAAALLDAMDAKLDAAHRMENRPPVQTLLYEPNGYATTGAVTDEMMTLAGLVDASPQLHPTRTGTVPVETVIAASPELLIFSGESGAPSSQAELLQHHPAFAALAGRTLSVRASLIPLACPGPWSADAALTFAELGAKARALAKAQAHN
jgi:iron complex transport system substrate-binding protein